ncbi:tRNA pseudouridine(38-40) synthase TruA [Maribacter dokdonensis]|uniref:tRNA pseudouridine(38-40) synthase TruA n=1 Tax=Maribacter dokdonensis TaxID=320912 RepID=UPI001C084170|nr:tRNA pseudouridine(38-40) synthase TruA [Maribacter dokdonensis]MBU2901957.1 tRNA pseudouridine(38-40) synthase TruA [Maribacter dokdonensis]
MKKQQFCYLVRLQYLGFRYNGWQEQPKMRTITGMLNKTYAFLYPDKHFKILGAGRTDAKVSSLDGAFELFVDDEIKDLNSFVIDFNKNLPPDIRLLSISAVEQNFNIIKDSKTKEYCYFFSFGTKNHPFSAPFITNYMHDLNLDVMKDGATLFIGTHDFSVYTAALKANAKTIRKIDSCHIEPNTMLTANFFPEQSYVLRIKGKGFMRYQIRMIMGALVQLGKGELSLDDIRASLLSDADMVLKTIAPGSGLILNELTFTN